LQLKTLTVLDPLASYIWSFHYS